MKKLQLLGLLLSPVLFVACDKDDNNKDVDLDQIQSKTYTGLNVLDLEYNDSGLAGKSVDVTPASGRDVSMSFYSKVNLGTLNAAFKDLPELEGPGVLPGTPKLDITVPVTRDGNDWDFDYTGETDFVTYRLEGDFDNNRFEGEFENVRLKNQTFAGGAWKPVAVPANPLADSQPFHIVWETKLPIQLPGTQYGIQDVLRILVNTPFIPVYNGTAEMSLTQVIANGLRTVGMAGDGCMPVTYLQTANGASQFITAPRCTFTYVPLSDNAIRLYANPTDILSLVLLNNTNRDPNIPDNPFGKASRAEEGTLLQLLEGIVKNLSPMLAEGLPMACVRQGDGMQLYLGSEVLVPLLKQVIVPVLSNPAMRGIIADLVQHNTSLSQYATAIMALYDALPTLLDQTTKIELGLNFTKAQ